MAHNFAEVTALSRAALSNSPARVKASMHLYAEHSHRLHLIKLELVDYRVHRQKVRQA